MHIGQKNGRVCVCVGGGGVVKVSAGDSKHDSRGFGGRGGGVLEGGACTFLRW
jgi:hypothetical protein